LFFHHYEGTVSRYEETKDLLEGKETLTKTGQNRACGVNGLPKQREAEAGDLSPSAGLNFTSQKV